MTRFSGPDVRGRLERAFSEALDHIRSGQTGEARDLLLDIIDTEPRFPEPYLELALIFHGNGDIERAIDQARMGLEMLDEYGQWVDDLTDTAMRAHAQVLLGHLLIEAAEAVDILVDRPRFRALWNEAAALFTLAGEADPSNEEAQAGTMLCRPLAAVESTDDPDLN